MQTIELDTEQLLEGCLANSGKAQESLYRQFYHFAMAIALRYALDEHDAANIMSHAFVKVFKSIRTFVVNEGPDHIKSSERFSQHVEIETAAEPEIANAALEQMGAKEIMNLVKGLPPATHAVFIMYAVEGFNHREIAERLNISKGTSKWHLSEARKTLQIQLPQAKHS